MKGCPGKSVLSMTLLLMVLATSIPGCWGATSHPEPVKVELFFSEPPILGKAVLLRATFKLQEFFTPGARGVTALVTLPEGFEKVDGDLEWKGDLKPGESHTSTAAVKATATGDRELIAKAEFENGPGSRYVGLASLYVSVSETGATVSPNPPGPTKTPGRKAPTFPPDMTPPPLPRTPYATSPAAANAQRFFLTEYICDTITACLP